MSIDFSTLQGLTIPEGVVTEIKDSLGRVIWSAIKEVGTIILRPSADISVEHALTPSGSAEAYLLINEEVADAGSTYIDSKSTYDKYSSVSKFRLAVNNQAITKPFVVTSVSIAGESYSSDGSGGSYKNEFRLEINGAETATVTDTSQKAPFDLSVSDAILMINEAVAASGALPDMNIIITSYTYVSTGSGGNKAKTYQSGVTQVYVVLGYEA